MGKRKYERDSEGRVILDVVNGIKVTRPWSPEMYKYNNAIQEKQKENLESALIEIYETNDLDRMKEFGKIVCGYGHEDDDIEWIYEDTKKAIKYSEKFWLREAYPEAVTKGFLNDNINKEYIGY